MNTWVVVAAVAGFASSAIAAPPIDLQPLDGRGVAIDASQTIVGTCGGAVVRVVDVTRSQADFYVTGLDSKIVVIPGPPHTGPHRQFVMDGDKGLSDYVGAACVPSPKGARLMVWTKCGGSLCGDHWSFFIIDPNGLTVFPADWHKTDCNAACASKRIGSRKPFEIDAE